LELDLKGKKMARIKYILISEEDMKTINSKLHDLPICLNKLEKSYHQSRAIGLVEEIQCIINDEE
jgi:hypothetical protein